MQNAKYYTRKDLSGMFKVCDKTIARWEAKGLLNPLRFNQRVYRYSSDDVERLLQEIQGKAA